MRRRAPTKVPAGVEEFDFGRQPQRNLAVARRSTGSTREAILSGMLEVVGLVGYGSTSLGMVLGPAGVSMRSFELEFEDKEACYLAAYDAALEEAVSLLVWASKEEGNWRGRLLVGLDTLLCFLDAKPAVARAMLVEVHTVGPGGKARVQQTLGRAARFFELARVEPRAREVPPQIAGTAVASGIYGILYRRLASELTAPLRELLPELVHYAVLPYFGAEAAGMEIEAARARLG